MAKLMVMGREKLELYEAVAFYFVSNGELVTMSLHDDGSLIVTCDKPLTVNRVGFRELRLAVRRNGQDG